MIDREPEEIKMNYKGNSYLDTGYIFAPYVPITKSPIIYDSNSPNGIISCYGKKLLEQSDTVSIDQAFADYGTKKPTKAYRSIMDDWEISQFAG